MRQQHPFLFDGDRKYEADYRLSNWYQNQLPRLRGYAAMQIRTLRQSNRNITTRYSSFKTQKILTWPTQIEPGGSLHALRYLSNVRYSKNSEKWYYVLQK